MDVTGVTGRAWSARLTLLAHIVGRDPVEVARDDRPRRMPRSSCAAFGWKPLRRSGLNMAAC